MEQQQLDSATYGNPTWKIQAQCSCISNKTAASAAAWIP